MVEITYNYKWTLKNIYLIVRPIVTIYTIKFYMFILYDRIWFKDMQFITTMVKCHTHLIEKPVIDIYT